MLEGIFVIRYIIVVIVGVSKERIAIGKHIRGADVGGGKQCLVWVFDGKYFFGWIGEVLTQLVPQVGIGVAVANNLDGLRGSDAAVVGGDDDLIVAL